MRTLGYTPGRHELGRRSAPRPDWLWQSPGRRGALADSAGCLVDAGVAGQARARRRAGRLAALESAEASRLGSRSRTAAATAPPVAAAEPDSRRRPIPAATVVHAGRPPVRPTPPLPGAAVSAVAGARLSRPSRPRQATSPLARRRDRRAADVVGRRDRAGAGRGLFPEVRVRQRVDHRVDARGAGRHGRRRADRWRASDSASVATAPTARSSPAADSPCCFWRSTPRSASTT